MALFADKPVKFQRPGVTFSSFVSFFKKTLLLSLFTFKNFSRNMFYCLFVFSNV